jgi:ATP-binding cassette, subfamily B (MDR/TAP), member 1
MKTAKISPKTDSMHIDHSLREQDVELMEGGLAATANDPDKLFNSFRDDVKRRIEKYQASKG